IEPVALGAFAQKFEDGFGQAAEFRRRLFPRFSFRFINYLEELLPPVFRDIVGLQKIGPEFPVADPHDEVIFGESEAAKKINGKSDKLDICGYRGFTDDVAVELEMLPEAAALLFFVAEELPDRKPFDWFLEFA